MKRFSILALEPKIYRILKTIKQNIIVAQPALAGSIPNELYKASCSGPGRSCVGCQGSCQGSSKPRSW